MSSADQTTTGRSSHRIETAQPRVAVVTTLGCPYCKKAKASLKTYNIDFEELDLAEQPETLKLIKQATGQATVPQVFVGGKLIGGASELLSLLEDGSLPAMVAAAPPDPLPPQIRQAVEDSRKAGASAGAAQQGPSGDLARLTEEMRREGPPRSSPPDCSFPLQAAVDWVAASQQLPPAAALDALSRLQAVQLLTLQASARSPAAHAQHSALSRVPLLGALLHSPSSAPSSLSQGESDVAISAALLKQSPDVRVRLVGEGGAPPRLGHPLNTHYAWFGPARPAEQVAESLRSALLRLYDRHMTEDGKKVDYAALRADPDWQQFVNSTAELQKVDPTPLSRDQRLAFFINIYNALVVHALVSLGPATDTLGRLKWFAGIKYVIGGREFSSNDIEHGVLRGNAPSPAALFSLLGKPQWAGHTFKKGDPRLALAITPVDPRIHFALNCGANSCPAIKVYSPHNLEEGLASAAAAFCSSEVEVLPEAREVRLSMILKWYAPDFGSRRDLLRFLLAYLPPDTKAKLEGLLAEAGDDVEESITLSYRPYDWGVNSK